MKRLILMVLCSYVIFACQSKFSSDVTDDDGGYVYREIFVQSSGSLTPAHGYVYECPVSGGEYELKLISYGVDMIDQLDQNTEIALSAGEGFPVTEKDQYDLENGSPRYLQTIKIVASENRTGKPREAKFRVLVENYLFYAAEITIRQAGR
jgi:hypothetical protein